MELYIITYIPVLLTGLWAFYKYNQKRNIEKNLKQILPI